MSYQIVKKLRTEDGMIRCEMCSNNVRPKTYYRWEKEDNKETRLLVRSFLRDRVWQTTQYDTKFMQELLKEQHNEG